MQKSNTSSQAGIALLVFLIAIMGIAGIMLVNYTKGVLNQINESKFQHNQRVLKEAKTALLQFAYNYPVTYSNGPGRLPCADTDNDGKPETTFGNCSVLGRLPWNQKNLGLYDIRDADGERLWYAVSENFSTQDATILNSETSGTITVRDQSGNIIYDGSNPAGLFKYGVAAVIIAPGDITARNGIKQNRSTGTEDPFDTTADTEPGIVDAINYLDRLVGTEDNASFTQNSATDGFMLGPADIQSSNAINDQMIIITAAEVIEVAEKSVLQSYSTAISDYLAITGNVYPWLYNYRVDTIPELNKLYPADKSFSKEITDELGNAGRIPSMFGPYFAEANTAGDIQSMLTISLTSADFMGAINYNRIFPSAATGTYTFTNNIWNGDLTNDGPADLSDTIAPNDPVTGLIFEDDAVVNDNIAKLKGVYGSDHSLNAGQSTFYFWDRKGVDSVGWAKCKSVHLIDCHVDAGFIPIPHASGVGSIQILKVDIFPIKVIDSSAPFPLDLKYNVSNVTAPPGPLNNVTITPADANGHAKITAQFQVSDFIGSPFYNISYEWDNDYTDGDWNVDESGTLPLRNFPGATVDISLRYYPELPDWAVDDNWHNSVMLAYANAYLPNDPLVNCSEGINCLTVSGVAGNNDNKKSILIIGGEHDWSDQGNDAYFNDLNDIFDPENDDLDNLYDARVVGGNDKILVFEECAVAACP